MLPAVGRGVRDRVAVVLGVIVFYHAKAGRGLVVTIALGLLLGGAIGNLIDRLQYGSVDRLRRHGHRHLAVLHVQPRRCGDLDGDRAADRDGRVPEDRGLGARWLRPGPTRRAGPDEGGADDEVEDDDLEPGFEPPAPQPSIPPGPRRLLVPEGEVVRRVDRFVADRTGLSRSYVQKLISEGRLVDDAGRQLRANSEVRGGGVTLEVPPPEVPYHLEPDPTIDAVGRVRGR